MPKPVELIDDAGDVLTRAEEISFFSRVGAPIEGVVVGAASDWKSASRLLLSRKTINYHIDARNEVSTQCFLRNQAMYNQWDEIVDTANVRLVPVVEAKIRSNVPLQPNRADAVTLAVINMIRMAVVERQLREWHDSDVYLRIFEWLERGRLPCGNTEEYPQGHLIIY